MNPKYTAKSKLTKTSVPRTYTAKISDIELTQCLTNPGQRYRPLSPTQVNSSPGYALSLRVLLWIFFSFVLIKLVIYHLQIIANVFPNEYREGAILLTTDLMVNGGNPYALANQPEYTNVYGIFYHLIVLPFAKWFGINFPVHRAVSAFFIWASCWIFFDAMRWQKVPWVFAFSSTLILYGHLLYFTTPLARPDSLGFFLFLSSLLIPWRCLYSFWSLLVSILLGVLAFLTKPYFILSIFYLTLYLFICKSKKDAIKYGILSLIVLIIAILGINHFFETYFNNTLWINVNVAGNTFKYAFQQVYEYARINWGIIFIFLVSIFYAIVDWHKDDLIHRTIKWKCLNLDFFNLNQPLINFDIGLINFCLILSLFLFLCKFGQHQGSWLTYIHQLISPFLLLVTFGVFKPQIKNRNKSWLSLILTLLVFLNLLSISSSQLLPRPDYSLKEWNNLRALLLPHQHIFNSPAIVSILIEQGKKVYDSGQSEYFLRSSANQEFWDVFMPGNRIKIKQKIQGFLREVNQNLQLNKYDLIVLTKGHYRFISEELLTNYYEYKKTVLAPMSAKVKRNWELDIWQPKS